MHKFTCAIVLLVSVILPFGAHAAFECNVTVNDILVYSDGVVNVRHSGRGDYTVICNLRSEVGGVSVTTCAMWAAMLQAIKKKNGTASFYYPGSGSCATLPTYGSAPIPTYIGDVTP